MKQNEQKEETTMEIEGARKQLNGVERAKEETTQGYLFSRQDLKTQS